MINTWEPTRDVLTLKQNKVDTTNVSSYLYHVNDIGQRTKVIKDGSAFAAQTSIDWGYDALGQVIKAEHSANSLFNRAYQFDGIGNRLKSADSLTLPSSNNYTPNALNQYTAIDILTPTYDDDGNMTSGPLPAAPNTNNTLAWDAEHRLISATVGSESVTYHYDAQSRRIATTVDNETTLYLYDAWNPIAEYQFLTSNFTLLTSYTWGMDLSGTLQGAGGVGGLLSMAVHDTTITTFYPTYDGNGNISEYINDSGAKVAHFEYDPFGNLTVDSENNAAEFPYRFSTKPQDSTTGLYYYGYRWYDPTTGSWPSRDPIEESGGLNVYGFVNNSCVNIWDALGLWFANGARLPKDDNYRFYLDGKGGYRVRPGKVGNNPEVKAAAENHELRHINRVKASGQAHAVPYKQVYCFEKDGVRKWFYIKFVGGSLKRVPFKSGENMLWPSGTGVSFTTWKELKTEEIREVKAEIEELQNAKQSEAVRKRIALLQGPFVLGAYQAETRQGDIPAWKAFKDKYAAEKALAKAKGYGWAWKDESKVYKEIK